MGKRIGEAKPPKKYLFFIVLILSLFLFGCSSSDLNNKRLCQEGCLSKNLSYSFDETFKYNSTEFLKCSCEFYLEDS
jgi:hypothetical protein